MEQQIKITQTSNADMNIGVPKNLTAVEWLEELYYKSAGNLYGDDFEKARAMEQEQTKRVALHFIVLGGQECGCNWNKMNFTDEINKLING